MADRERDGNVHERNGRAETVLQGSDDDAGTDVKLENHDDLTAEAPVYGASDDDAEKEAMTEKTALLLAALPLSSKRNHDATERKKENRALVTELRLRCEPHV